MKRRAVFLPALITLAACQGSETTRPDAVPLGPPTFLISDGAHAGGNPDFFWLWPMVPPPVNHPNYDRGKANGDLRPDIFICALNATTPAQVTATTPCKSGGYATAFLGILPGFHVIAADDDIGQYHQFWKVPSSSDVFYRIRVRVGTKELGVADVQTSNRLLDLLNVNKALFTPQLDGTNMLIRFRIEQFALCSTPGVGPCGSEAVNLATGGNVTSDLTGAAGTSGVDIPPQGTGPTVTVTVSPCEDLNPRVTDLRTFGPCVSVTSDPPLPPGGLTTAGTVFVCEVIPFIPSGMEHEQTERITLHQFDAPSTLVALPHAPACGGASVGSVNSVKGVFADLRRGDFRSAGRQLVAIVSPRPLHAAVVIDVGAGGRFRSFSDFQFALPGKLEIVEGDGQSAVVGTAVAINPKVIVTDLAGDPVEGARVRFAATATACAALAAGTGTNSASDGTVTSSPWVLTTPGTNNISACGRGLGGSDFNGPRTGVDPFQPIQAHFDGSDPVGGPVEVPVLTGSVTFTGTGVTLPLTLVDFGDGGYNTYGPCAFSGTPAAGTTDCVPPAGWPSPAAGVSATIGAVSPFRGVSAVCAITPAGTTTFPTNNDIFVTRSFDAPVAGTLQITVQIDNDLKIWLDGVEKTNLIPTTSNGSYNAGSTWWQHANCANLGPAVLSLPVSAGAHTISMWGHDWGTVSYLSMQVVLNPPSP